MNKMNDYLKLMIMIIVGFMPKYSFGVDFNIKQLKVIKDIVWAADYVGVPRELALAVCWGESTFRTKGVTKMDGSSLSHGICQVKLETARLMDHYFKNKRKATSRRLEITKINALYAAQYLKYQLDQYNGDWMLAVDAYNKGTAIGTSTTYVKRVKRFKELFKHMTFYIGFSELPVV